MQGRFCETEPELVAIDKGRGEVPQRGAQSIAVVHWVSKCCNEVDFLKLSPSWGRCTKEMTKPRQVLKNRTYMLTRRCSERRFFLRPSKQVNQAFVYCFAVAAQKYQIDVYWLSVLSNHHHPGVKDKLANYPEFLGYFHSLLARCLNAHHGRYESFWSNEQSGVLLLGDGEAIFDKMIYALTNPVKDHLVDRVLNWPGFNSLRYQLSGKPVVVERPKWFFDEDGDMPEQVELKFVRPPEFAHLSQQEWTDKIRAAVAEQERIAAEARKETGRRIVGRKAILRQSPHSSPKTRAKRRGMVPRVASKNKKRRVALLAARKRFQERYRDAFIRRSSGESGVVFPYGTYKLRLQGLSQARCEPPPALE